ncbi:hypothetical protein FG87_26525 [Nocardia vulneris]|uniref:Integral membrane protein n=2 Tax=Nocardia vulneris TaxID=1141657 RepID=A0ABR4Z9V9_9NOCA|nr:hypothetical protein FG87_26525 [Nocardia vulneris]
MLALVLLVDAAADTARDEAAGERQRRDARVTEQLRARQRQAADLRRRVLIRAGRLAIRAVVLAFLVSASGAMAAAFSDDVADTVWFAAYDVRSVTFGDFVSLWLYAAVVLLSAVAALTVLAFQFPYPPNREVVSPAATWGFAVGVVLFIVQGVSGAGAGAWWLPSAFAVVGHLAYGIYRGTRAGSR